jgi:D-glucosaminate-specific PTS system IIC component
MITVFQAILLGIFAYFAVSEWVYGGWVGMTIMSKPIVIAAICGVIMGDMHTAMIIGVTIQALYIGATIIGGVESLPSIGMSAWFAIPLAIVTGGTAEVAAQTALTICLACSPIEMALRQLGNVYNQAVLHMADAAVEKGDLKKGMLIPYVGTQAWRFLTCIIIVPTMCLLGQDVVIAAVGALPDWVLGIVSTFVSLLPLLGFMILLSCMLKNKAQWILFLLGFALVKSAGLNIITVTVIAVAVAYVIFLCTPETKEA